MATIVAMVVGMAGLSAVSAQESIDPVVTQWQDRFNAGDAAGVADLYTPDGVLRHASAEVDRGHEEIEAWAAESIAAGLTFTVTPTEWEELSDTVASGLASWSAATADGTVVAAGEIIGVYTWVDGEWKIHRHFSGTVPAVE
jgi:uncharacterized protein (TIGR02246 family)